jgi:hypothetical protein
MPIKMFLIIALIISVVSCDKKPQGNKQVSKKAVINADCDYYDSHRNILGRLEKGQEIFFIGSKYYLNNFDVVAEAAMSVKGKQSKEPIYVSEKNITFLDGERYDFWFKNTMMTREYYYTGTPEEIYANSGYGRGINQGDVFEKEMSLRLLSDFYSEERLRFSDNYLFVGNDEFFVIYRLESAVQDGNTYTLQLSNILDEEYEVTLTDDGDGITITKYILKEGYRELDSINSSLNFKYVPYENAKSQKTKEAVAAWCNSQLESLTGNIF